MEAQSQFLQRAQVEGVSSETRGRNQVGAVRSQLVSALVEKNAPAAERVLKQLLGTGLPSGILYDEFIQPAVTRLGVYTSSGQISQARASAANEIVNRLMLMTSDHYRLEALQPGNPRVVLGCLDSEDHDLGYRILSERFKLAGWLVEYLGTAIDQEQFLNAVGSADPQLVGISIDDSGAVGKLAELIQSLHSRLIPTFKIMVGGPPFSIRPDLGLEVGADFVARNAREALAKASRYVNNFGELGQSEVLTLVV